MKTVMLFLLMFTPGFAYAYLDPGTGSLLLQALIGTIAAGLGVVSLYWGRFKAMFTRKKSKEEDT